MQRQIPARAFSGAVAFLVALTGVWLVGPVRAPGTPGAAGRGVQGRTGKHAAGSPAAAGEGIAAALARAEGAYRAREYARAEAEALPVAGQATSGDPFRREAAARARHLLAFAAARRGDFPLARSRFARLRREAAGEAWRAPETQAYGTPAVVRRPGDGPEAAGREMILPMLEEEAAYQHAVLTVALGEKSVAEREFLSFLREYPGSPLIHAAIRRIERLRGGETPKEAEAAWKQALTIAREREEARERARSLCGPEVLAEVLRRSGKAEPANAAAETHAALARELGTDRRGTSLSALAKAARKRGFRAQGLALTWKGLFLRYSGRLPSGERTPPRVGGPGGRSPYLIAHVQPGHFVLVETVTADGVTAWDSSAGGIGRPGVRRFTQTAWRRAWTGIVLALE